MSNSQGFLVLAEHGAEDVGDFTDRCSGLHGVEDEGEQVVLSAGGGFDALERR